MEVFGGGAAACLSEVVKAQGLEIPGAGILFLGFPLAHDHFHSGILQTVVRHLDISQRRGVRDFEKRWREDLKAKGVAVEFFEAG